MTGFARPLVLAAAATALSVAPALAAAPALHVGRIDTSQFPTVTLNVTTGSGAAKAPAFRVREDGKDVAGLQVAEPGQGTAIALAIDSSQSMRGEPLARAIDAARNFALAKRANDQMAVYSFGRRVQTVSQLTPYPSDIQNALSQLAVDRARGTALEDAVTTAAHDLAPVRVGNRLLILLTDGTDTSSQASASAALGAARRAHLRVDAIGLHSRSFDRAGLARLSSATGGKLYEAATPADIASIYGRIGASLHRGYQLTYRSGASVPSVSVAVSAPGLAAASASFRNPSPVTSAAGSGAASSVERIGLALAVGIAVLAAILLASRPSKQATLRRRIQSYAGAKKPAAERRAGVPVTRRLMNVTERLLGRLAYLRRVGILLEQADLALRPAEVLWIQGGAAVLLGVLALLLGGGAFFGLVALGIGAWLPFLWLKRKAGKRRKAFERQLADTLVTIAASLKAGHSFAQAMSSFVKDGQEPASKEFARVENETRLGLRTDDAMQAMATRLASKNFEFVVLAVNIQRQVGGSLAAILDMVADTVRSREQFARKIKALTAMGRASAWVLIGMPFFIGTILWLLNDKYMNPLLFSSAGHFMLGVGAVSMFIGSYIIRKMVNFKY